ALRQGLAGNLDGVIIFGLCSATAFVVAWSASRPTPLERIPKLDWLMAIAGAISAAYLYIFYRELAMRPGAPTTLDRMIAGMGRGVSASFVFLLVLFGSMVARAGAGVYSIHVAFALLGHLRGGPAKAAVVASGLAGLISGSSIANAVTPGTFTIHLMKRVGYT